MSKMEQQNGGNKKKELPPIVLPKVVQGTEHANVGHRHLRHSMSDPNKTAFEHPMKKDCFDGSFKMNTLPGRNDQYNFCHCCGKRLFHNSRQSLPMLKSIYTNIAPPNCKNTKSMSLYKADIDNGYTPMIARKHYPGLNPLNSAKTYIRPTKEGTLQLHFPTSEMISLVKELKDMPPTKKQIDRIIVLLKDMKDYECSKLEMERSRNQGWTKDQNAVDSGLSTPRSSRVTFWDEKEEKNKTGGKSEQSSSWDRKLGAAKATSSQQASTSTEPCDCSWLDTLNNLNKLVEELEAENSKNMKGMFKNMYQQPKEEAKSFSVKVRTEAVVHTPRRQ